MKRTDGSEREREREGEKEREGNRNREQERVPWKKRVLRALDVPVDLLRGETLLELRGSDQLTLRGGGRILTYTPEEVSVALKRGRLSVRGRELVCTSYDIGALGVEGQIRCISFEEV